MKNLQRLPRWARRTILVVCALILVAWVTRIVVLVTAPPYPAWCADAAQARVTAREPAPIQSQLAALNAAYAQQGQVVSPAGMPTQMTGLMAALELRTELHNLCGIG